jgi:sugar lactone lactonase YvrE
MSNDATTLKTELLIDGLRFPEGPRWRDGKLWFSDMQSGLVQTVDLNGQLEKIAEVAQSPSGLGWLPDGRLLIVSMADRRLLRLDPEGLTMAADLSDLAPFHCNDMVVDKKGRAYVGNFGFDYANGQEPAGTVLIMVTPDGEKRAVADDLLFPNGAVISADDKMLVVAETFGLRLTAFDIAPDGSLNNRRVFAQFEDKTPDGICLDAEGAIWVASPRTSEIIRVLEGGKITHRIPTKITAVACMLGGPDGKTLFVLSGPLGPTPAGAPGQGRIEIVRVDIPGAGLP